MNPEPPDLVESAGDWKPNEFFWITKYGVRMTGMPAWDKTLTDKQIWAITATAMKLADTKPDEYQAILKSHAKK
jgi:mono/diheme cytochrome c family protein